MTYLPILSDYYISASYPYSTNAANNTTGPLYTDRAGYWFFYVSMVGSAVGSNDSAKIAVGAFINSTYRQETEVLVGNRGMNWTWGYGSYEYMPQSTYWQGRSLATALSGGSFTMNIYLFFIPTNAYRQ